MFCFLRTIIFIITASNKGVNNKRVSPQYSGKLPVSPENKYRSPEAKGHAKQLTKG